MKLTEIEKMSIAILIHETNRAFCEMTGDASQEPWESAEDWQRESARSIVQDILNNPDPSTLSPETIHNQWMEQKQRDGWNFGPVKDGVLKTHPSLIPFLELPCEERIKDYLVLSVTLGVLRSLQPNEDNTTNARAD